MLRSQRLEVVLTLERRREQEALEQLAKAREAYQTMQQRRQELEDYQRDYCAQLRESQLGVVAVNRLQGLQAFVAQLNQVLAQQQQQLDQADARLAECRQHWQQAYQRRRGMENFIASCRQQEQREADRREQQEQDEAAAAAFRRRR
ncbi:flagellar export protein FliJ [Marinobacter sp. X15-166B]|uniref:flagellar export protein FliJ n=1 Tax=Marinobacter sp. X15-166B TaxID=1897620 RepID=UPI00085C7556|nr:flagellar export protein FliJ [Marinobacter sp. X15-166B]OEY67067.1 flagellar export protein FliJ [Marinobacter sp. X15-166B]